MKKIAIIGAGLLGIGILHALKQQEFIVDVYEEKDDVGGTWHPDNCYADLKIHNMAFTIAFPDFPLPENIDPYERISSSQVFAYLKSFCHHFKLYQNINFDSRCDEIFYKTDSQKHTLLINKLDTNYLTKEYDYVVYTHGFTDRSIPYFVGKDSFLGDIYHSFSITDEKLKQLVLENKKIVIIGGSKTATDFILAFQRYDYKVKWLCREPYWFYNFSFQKELLISLNSRISGKIKRMIFLFGFVFVKDLPMLTYFIWSSLGCVHSYAPSKFNIKKFHAGLLDTSQIALLRAYYKQNAISSEIESLSGKNIRLKNREQIEADVIICCTGSGPKKFPKVIIDGQVFELEQARLFYHSAVFPELPKLIFTAYLPFGFGIAKSLLAANWVSKYIEHAPDTLYLQQHAVKQEPGFLFAHPLFDSKKAFLAQGMIQIEEFIKSGELSRSDYIKWLIANIFSGKATKPIPFKFPKSHL